MNQLKEISENIKLNKENESYNLLETSNKKHSDKSGKGKIKIFKLFSAGGEGGSQKASEEAHKEEQKLIEKANNEIHRVLKGDMNEVLTLNFGQGGNLRNQQDLEFFIKKQIYHYGVKSLKTRLSLSLLLQAKDKEKDTPTQMEKEIEAELKKFYGN